MSLTSVNAAVQLLLSISKTLNAARERAQATKDATLKDLINTLYDDMLALKEVVQRVTDENARLQQSLLVEKSGPEIRQVGAENFYFDGDKGPFCVPCYINKTKLSPLSAPQEWNGGLRRRCPVCEKYFYERPMDDGPAFAVNRR
jgi:hypothetical protein